LGAQLRLKTNKKRVSRPRVVQPVALTPNERWSLDFVSDTLGSGPRLKVLTAVDHFSRVSPAIEVDTSLPAKRVIEVLERATEQYGLPQMLCVDNGPEFTSRALDRVPPGRRRIRRASSCSFRDQASPPTTR
jgi:putative transposase